MCYLQQHRGTWRFAALYWGLCSVYDSDSEHPLFAQVAFTVCRYNGHGPYFLWGKNIVYIYIYIYICHVPLISIPILCSLSSHVPLISIPIFNSLSSHVPLISIPVFISLARVFFFFINTNSYFLLVASSDPWTVNCVFYTKHGLDT